MNFFSHYTLYSAQHIKVDLKKTNHAMDISLYQTNDVSFKSNPPNFQWGSTDFQWGNTNFQWGNKNFQWGNINFQMRQHKLSMRQNRLSVRQHKLSMRHDKLSMRQHGLSMRQHGLSVRQYAWPKNWPNYSLIARLRLTGLTVQLVNQKLTAGHIFQARHFWKILLYSFSAVGKPQKCLKSDECFSKWWK